MAKGGSFPSWGAEYLHSNRVVTTSSVTVAIPSTTASLRRQWTSFVRIMHGKRKSPLSSLGWVLNCHCQTNSPKQSYTSSKIKFRAKTKLCFTLYETRPWLRWTDLFRNTEDRVWGGVSDIKSTQREAIINNPTGDHSHTTRQETSMRTDEHTTRTSHHHIIIPHESAYHIPNIRENTERCSSNSNSAYHYGRWRGLQGQQSSYCTRCFEPPINDYYRQRYGLMNHREDVFMAYPRYAKSKSCPLYRAKSRTNSEQGAQA